MELFNKKAKTFQSMFPDNVVQKSLEALSWRYMQSNDKPFETIKLKQIEKESEMLYVYLMMMQPRKKYGDYIYSRRHSSLERESPKIALRHHTNPKVKLGTPMKIRIKKRPVDSGMIYKID